MVKLAQRLGSAFSNLTLLGRIEQVDCFRCCQITWGVTCGRSCAQWCSAVQLCDDKKVKESESPLSLVLEQSCPWEDPPPPGAGGTQDTLPGGA